MGDVFSGSLVICLQTLSKSA